MMPALPIEGYDTTREDGVTRIRPVYAAPLPVEAVSVQGQGLLPQETPALPVELPVAQPSGILAEADRALSGAVRAPFDALDERLFGKSGKKGTYREAIQKFFKNANEVGKNVAQADSKFAENTSKGIEIALKHPIEVGKQLGENLIGLNGKERFQTFPEKIVRDAIAAPHDVMQPNPYPEGSEENYEYERRRQNGMIKAAMDVSNLAGTGGLAGAGSGAGVALGSGPIKRLPSGEALSIPPNPTKANMVNLSRVETVPLASARGTQSKIQWDKFDKGEHPEPLIKGYEDMPIAVKKENGEYLIYDGHHRTVKAMNDGQIDMPMYVLDAKSYAPELAGRPKSKTEWTKSDDELLRELGTTTLKSDNQPSVGIGAVSKSEKPFYSALERSLGSINQNKASGEQWLGMLANKGGVKPDELQWSGVSEFLAGKPSVTKAEIDSFLKDNPFGVQEVVKGGAPKKLDQLDKSERLQLINEFREREGLPSNEIPTRQELQQFLNDKSGNANAKATRYHDYQLPGGENYREVLMTLPYTRKASPKTFDEWAKENGLKYSLNNVSKYQKWVRENYDATDMPSLHRSSHWDEPNILAHMRMNDRTIDGKKSLHLEEIQSDWHQAGRKKGYQDGKPGTLYLNGKVPDAPFKKNWHELALKRAIREAAENGYDRLSWTPGEAQAARYDLSKSIDELVYYPSDNTLQAFKNGREVMYKKDVPTDKLPDFVGKEAADKLINNPTKKTPGKGDTENLTLSGQDLKVGGEGMKGFYDNIVPKTIEKLGKQFGVKVQTGKSGKHTIYYIDIPPAMRDKVLAEGFPLFSANVPVIDNDQAR